MPVTNLRVSYKPNNQGSNFIKGRFLVLFIFLNIVLLTIYLVLQIRFHDKIKMVGFYDRLLAKVEERLVVMEGDISIFQGVTALWTMVGERNKYTESPEQVIYLSSPFNKEDGYQAYRSE